MQTFQVSLKAITGEAVGTPITVHVSQSGSGWAGYTNTEDGTYRMTPFYGTEQECVDFILDGGIGTIVIDDY